MIGNVDDTVLRETAADTASTLERLVHVRPSDTVLEIGCGIGRVGEAVAPRCAQWIGCDVSPTMLDHARERLAEHANVRLVEISGFDLAGIADASIDVVYCTVVFMHLDEWDRYAYVVEAIRVLRPGGRIYVDNFNLASDRGFAIFEQHRALYPRARPAHISKSSTPEEIHTYLTRAGFSDSKIDCDGEWVRGVGTKPG